MTFYGIVSVALKHYEVFTKTVGARLEQLLPLLNEDDEYTQCKTRQFIDGLRAAAEAGEDVDFH